MPLSVTILGCGSSGGVPRPGSGWGACDPAEPRNRRRRCSILVRRGDGKEATQVLVDASPDLREQLLSAAITRLDGVLISHDHADHLHGIDDLRSLVLHMRRRITVHADAVTGAALTTRFDYLFRSPPGSLYPPVLDLATLRAGTTTVIDGPGGPIEALPFDLEHGPGYGALGFRFGAIGYAPDVSRIPPPAQAALSGLDILILDCLREAAHPSHFNRAQALEAIATLKPRRAILTNLHNDLDYANLSKGLPAGVEAAFDGMALHSDA